MSNTDSGGAKENARTPQKEMAGALSLLTLVMVVSATATVALFMGGYGRFGVITTVVTVFAMCGFAALNSARGM